MTDFQFRYDDTKGYYDIVIDANGDLANETSLDSAIYMSLFCDKRADESEVQVPELRRGWWGNELNEDGYEIGSKLWLLEQRRATQDTLNDCKDYIYNCLQWLLEKDAQGYSIVKELQVDTAYQSRNVILANIRFTGYDNTVNNKTYQLFLNSIPNG